MITGGITGGIGGIAGTGGAGGALECRQDQRALTLPNRLPLLRREPQGAGDGADGDPVSHRGQLEGGIPQDGEPIDGVGRIASLRRL